MESPDKSPQLASSAMMLSQLDRVFDKIENQNLVIGHHNDLAVLTSFIQENLGIADCKTNVTQIQTLPACSIASQTTKHRFISILRRALKGQEGISRQERNFVEQFWCEIRSNIMPLYAAGRV